MKLRGYFARSAVIASMAIASAGCNAGDVFSAGSLAVSTVSAMMKPSGAGAAVVTGVSKETADDTKRLYLSTVKRGAAAFRSGVIAVSSDADVDRDNFCEMVLKDVAQVSDRGGLLSAAECRAKDQVDKMFDALERGDAAAFALAKGKAGGHIAEMETIIAAAEKEATP